MLGLTDVHVQVFVPRVLADHHPLVDLHAGADEQGAPLLRDVESVGAAGPGLVRDQRAVGLHFEGARIGLLVAGKHVVQDDGALGLGQQRVLQADHPAGRDVVLDVQVAVDRQLHVAKLAAAPADFFDDRALELHRHLDGQFFVRLQRHPVRFAQDHFRLGDLELVAFPAHCLDEDRKVQFATAGDQELVGGIGFFRAQGDVGLQFLVQPFAQVAGGDVLAFPSGEGARIDRKGHLDGRLVDRHGWHGDRLLGIGQGLADHDLREAGDGHDFARLDLVHLFTFQSFEDKEVSGFAGD